MSRACPKPDEEVCSIKKPVARNPRKNRWIDHINKEAKRLKISYMSAVGDKRVKESYAQNKFKSMTLKTKKTKAKGLIKADRKKGLGKKGDLDRELELLEDLDQPLVRKAPKAKTPITPPISPEIINAPLSPAFVVSPQVKTPKFRSATPPRKNPESIIRNPKTRIISRRIVEKPISPEIINAPFSPAFVVSPQLKTPKSNSTKKALKQLIADSPITPGSAMQLSTPGSAFIRTSTPTLKQLLASPYQPPKPSVSRFKRNQEKAKRQMEKLNL
jgi:hypothetical protein